MKNKVMISVIIVVILILSVILIHSRQNSSNTNNNNSTTANSPTVTSQPASSVLVKSKDGSVSVTVPTGWNTNDTTLWTSADIAVSNDNNGEYFLILKRPKSAYTAGLTIDQFVTGMKDVFNEILTNPVWSQTSSTTVKNLTGQSMNLTGTGVKSGTHFEYWINVVQDSNNFYELIGYSNIDKAQTNQATVEDILNSFTVSS